MDDLGWRPAKRPDRTRLRGDTVLLERLEVGRNGGELYRPAAGADSTWDYLPYGPFAGKGDFMACLDQGAPVDDPLTFTLIDRQSHAARGLASFMRIVPEHGVIEIGHIWLSPQLQRTRQATEAIYLMSRHAFDDLGNRRLEWKCNAANAASRRAAERFGFTFEGVFRHHMLVKGRNRDTAWYSITDSEWPTRRAAFEAWLAPANFDPAGVQRRALGQVRGGIEVSLDR